MKEKPFLLLSNDDGFAAKGIQELIKVLRSIADLMVVAPSGPRSGASGSITSEHPLRCTQLSLSLVSRCIVARGLQLIV